VSAKLRNEIGINKFESADRTPKVGALLAGLGTNCVHLSSNASQKAVRV
jgi:hypothetical protein